MSAVERKFADAWQAKLMLRKSENSLRSLSLHDNGVDFFSNDYLGLAQSSNIVHESIQGSTGSRLISGNSSFHERLETEIANYFGSESALLYNSGYDANLGLLSCIADRADTIIYDEHVHASMRDGLRLSQSRSFSFHHNDIEHLEAKLKAASGKVFVAIEGIYSMTGDQPPLLAVYKLCQEYEAYLIVDEAHSLGFYKKGLCHDVGIDPGQVIRIITFGKAMGYHGAAVLTNNVLKQYLINFSRSLIYTTAMPTSSVQALSKLIEVYDKADNARKNLKRNIAAFKKLYDQTAHNGQSIGPVQMVYSKSRETLHALQSHLISEGMLVKSIFHPTVPKNSEGIRLCIHSFNTTQQIEALCHSLNTFKH